MQMTHSFVEFTAKQTEEKKILESQIQISQVILRLLLTLVVFESNSEKSFNIP